METSQQSCSNETATEGLKLRSADPLLCHGSSLPDSPPPGTVNNVVVRGGGPLLRLLYSGLRDPGTSLSQVFELCFLREKCNSHSVCLHPGTLGEIARVLSLMDQ